MTQKSMQNPWTMDVRVRERNLKSGALTEKDLEKHLSALPDVADQAEPFGTSQPALAQPVQHHAPAPAAEEAAPAEMASSEEEPDEPMESSDLNGESTP